MSSRKDEVAEKFRELAELTILDEGSPQAFRVRAYENAAAELKVATEDIATMSVNQLTKLPGIGKSTAQKIREYLDTGTIAKLDTLRTKYPPDFVALSRTPGLGPKSVLKLRAELGVESIADLRQAIAAQKLRDLKGFGAKTEEKLAKALARIGDGEEKRLPIAKALPLAERITQALSSLSGVVNARYCGSLRRHRETIGDIDIVVAATAGNDVMKAFIDLPDVGETLVSGDKKTSVLTKTGMQIDLRVVDPSQFGAATLYFTGSKAHNIKLRQRALQRGYTLNEYGLFDGDNNLASQSEEAIYRELELDWVPAPMREDTGEVERSADHALVVAPTREQLIGDLHVHTELSGDARSSLEDIAAGALARGHSYIAITEHGEDLVINGVSQAQLEQQARAIALQQQATPGLRILRGCELNIGPEGGLDYDHDFRMSLDWCIAAIHSHFDLTADQQTERLLRAIRDPAVNVIGHISGRMIGKRPGIDFDVDKVLRAAEDTGTAIEINAALPRLDASSELLRRSHDRDITFVISTDTHHVDDMDRMRWGVRQAQRGWVPADRVANTWPMERFVAWAGQKRSKGPA